ncbi:hypothetical protein V6N13_031362 [Hibiscus sabdariffa]
MDPKLYQAVIKGDIAFMKELTSPDSTVLFWVTPAEDNILHVAAKYDANQIAEEIVKLPCSVQLVNRKNSDGDTPLHVAAKMGSLKTCQVLVNFANNMSGEIEAGEKLAKMVNSNKDTALHVAVRNGYHQIAELLIREDPGLTLLTNDAGESPLFLAVDRRHVRIAQNILEVAPDFSIKGRNNMNVLHAAVIRSKHEVFTLVDYFWELMSAQNIMTDSSLKYVIKAIPLQVCATLKIWSARTSNNYDYKNLVARLMMTGKNRSALLETDKRGWTPLHYAAHFGAVDIFDLFSKYISNENGSAAHIRDGNGRSVVHIAASEGEVNILKRLSDKQDNEGNTALHLAVIKAKRDKIFEFLIKDSRVDTTVANSAGHTVMDILLLQDHGYDYKKWITLTAASNGGLESLELAINKNGRKTEKKFEAAIDAQGLKNLNYDQLKEIGNTNALVATLVATVSFAASFTMPGGYKSDGPDEGMPILSGKSAFRASVMANVVAFALSTLSMAFHYYSSFMEKLESLAFYTNLSTTLLMNAIIAMVISFLQAPMHRYLVLPDWLMQL